MNPVESSTLQQAVSALRSDNKEEAMEWLKQLLSEHPGHELGGGMLASIYAELGMIEQAAALYQEVLAQHPDNPLARFQWGLLLFNRDQLVDALAVWEPLLASTDDFMAHFQSALAMAKLNHLSEARHLLSTAESRMPLSHEMRPHLEALQQALE